MGIKWTYSFLLILTYAIQSHGQISPGKLSASHEHLEGISNCTQCHDLGNKVPDQKCLDCHNEIDELIQLNRGFHVSSEVSSKSCTECHNDHHGRKFNMIRFDEDSFDHSLTGYQLEGNHAIIDCRECHKPDYIANVDLKKRDETFLGLGSKCLDCHSDYHQKTLGNDCIQCHNFDNFNPASKFDHKVAKFVLKGAHISVDCIECHPMTKRNGNDFQEFTGLAFNSCVDCHNDPHEGHLKGACIQCHTESSFTDFVGGSKFDHNATNFELKGSHKKVNCFECHTEKSDAKTVFQDNLNIVENNCVACHDDVHEGKFGSDCIKCHSEESFFSLKEMDFFDHSVTDFPLEGLHIEVDCKSCHKERFTEAIDFAQCKNCHEDYHNGEFTKNEVSPDCIECHVLEQKFTFTTYGFEEHNVSSFPLEGAHMATPCFACHVDEDHWSFRSIGESCVDCHDDIHKDKINSSFYPNQDCTVCHTVEQWKDVSFEHELTDWPLTGEHINVDCRSCHFESSENSDTFKQSFSDLSQECNKCHKNIHGDQFEIDNITDCNRCHDTASWFPNNFDHNRTSFPLDGKHAEIECKNCHSQTTQIEGEPTVIYKIERFECIDCHS